MRPNARAILLVLALLVAFLALNFIFIIDTPTGDETEQSASRSSYRSTPYGTLAFYTLLKESGYPVTRLERPFTDLEALDELGTLVIISPPAASNPSADEFESLSEWVELGGLLIVIDREIQASFGEASAATGEADLKSEARPWQPTRYTRGVKRVALSEHATRIKLDSHATTYHLGSGQGAVLADAKVGEGRVVLLTDPYVVANNGISQDGADNVILALNLFSDRPDGLIAFDEFHHGYGSQTNGGVMSYFRGTPVPWMMGQAALIALFIVYTHGRRFARPLPLKRERRTTNLEFVSSLANITRLARASDLAMQSIYSEFRNRLCRYSGMGTNAETARVASAVARRAKLNEANINRLLERCEEVARGAPVSDSELLDLITRIRDIESRLRL